MTKTSPSRPASQWLRALALSIALEAAFATLAWLGNLELYVVETIAIALGAGIVYLVSLYAFEHSPDSRRAFWLILLASLAFRLTLAPLRPTLSDDIFRYRFDGQVQSLGFNPYSVRPDDPRFAALAVHSIHEIPGHGIRSIYPPVSELVFAAAWRLVPGPVAFNNAKTQRALEKLMTARAGKDAMAQFTAEFEKGLTVFPGSDGMMRNATESTSTSSLPAYVPPPLSARPELSRAKIESPVTGSFAPV